MTGKAVRPDEKAVRHLEEEDVELESMEELKKKQKHFEKVEVNLKKFFKPVSIRNKVKTLLGRKKSWMATQRKKKKSYLHKKRRR